MFSKISAPLLAGGLVFATAISAYAQAPDSSPKPSQPQGQPQEMMQGGGHMNMMGNMGPEHMQQMTKMMENCNRMMERADNAGSPPKHE